MESNRALLVLLFCILLFRPASAQNAAFSYQGRLISSGQPANGAFDFRFLLTDAATNGNSVALPFTVAPVPVSNGLFTTTVNFGPGVFDGSPCWLEIAVRTNGSAGLYTTLAPRQPVTSVPYTSFAANLSAGATLSGNGAALTNLTGSSIQPGTITSAQLSPATWQLATAPGSNALAIVTTTYSGRDDLNRWSWINTLKKIAKRQPIQLMIFGDSVASGSFVPIYNTLRTVYGSAGAIGSGGDAVFNMTVTPPAYWVIPPTNEWFENYCVVTNGGIITWHSFATTSITGNVLEVDYIARSNGGTFKLQTNINNTVWNDVAGFTLVNADNHGAPTGMVIRITNSAPAAYQIRVLGLSGAAEFPGAGIVNYAAPGIIYSGLVEGGATVGDLSLRLPDSVTGPFVRSWAPDLIICHVRDTPELLQTSLPAFHDYVAKWLTNSDIVFIGMSPAEVDDQYWSVQQNQIIRSNAAAFGWGYFDGYHIFGSFTNGLQHGLLQLGDVHPTQDGYNFVADVLFNWLGLAETLHLNFWNAPGLAATAQTAASTAIAPAALSAAAPTWTTGKGSPEGKVQASVGSVYTRTDGGPGTTLYVKESGVGNTGWSAK